MRRRWRRAIARPAWCCPRRLSPHAAGASGQLHDGVDGVGPVPPLHVLHCGGGDRAIILHGGGGDVVRDELRLGLVELVDRFVLSVMSPWRSRSAARSSRMYTAACRTFFLSTCRRALSALPAPRAPALSAGCSSPNFGAGHLCGHSCCGRDPTIKSRCRSDLYSPSIMTIMRWVFSSSSLIAGRKNGVQRPRAGLARPQRRSGTGGSDAIYFRFGTLRSFFHLRRPPELDACRQKPPKQ